APLGAPAAVAGGDAAVDVAPTGLAQALGQLALRLGSGDRLAQGVGGEAAPGARRFCLAVGHPGSYAVSAPSTSSVRSPGASCTIAFFQPRDRPWVRPRRFGFGRTLETRTLATETSKISSTACATCVLWTRSSTLNVYLPSPISA